MPLRQWEVQRVSMVTRLFVHRLCDKARQGEARKRRAVMSTMYHTVCSSEGLAARSRRRHSHYRSMYYLK